MRLQHLTISFITIVLLLSSSLAAQELTLNDCIELALNNRASIIAARGREAVAKAGKLSALGAFLPRVDASYNYNKGKETGIKSYRTTEYKDTVLVNKIGRASCRERV